MNDLGAMRGLLADGFGRVDELVGQTTTGLTEDLAMYRPDPDANSVAWLIWHACRVQDDHVADLAGIEQVWPAWRDRFSLPFGPWDTGFGHSSEQVGQVRASGDLLAGYHHEVDQLTQNYVAALTFDELARIVDDSWQPPVSVAVRLVSVLGDTTQHLGQASYVRGLAQRAGGIAGKEPPGTLRRSVACRASTSLPLVLTAPCSYRLGF